MLFSDIIIVGETAIASITDLWVKLVSIGFFDGITATSGIGVDRFTELIDAFPSYLGRGGQLLIVNESEQKIETITYNIFTDTDATKLGGIEMGAQKNVNPDFNSTDPSNPATILNMPPFTGGFNQIYDELFTYIGGTQDFDMVDNVVVFGVQLNGSPFVKKQLYTVVDNIFTYLEPLSVNDELIIKGLKF